MDAMKSRRDTKKKAAALNARTTTPQRVGITGLLPSVGTPNCQTVDVFPPDSRQPAACKCHIAIFASC